MAPSSANRNPETRKPARALPLPGARVAPVLLAMSIIFDCIISDATLGRRGAGARPAGQTGYSQPIPKAGIGGSPRFAGVSTFGICRTGSRKRKDPGAVALSFSRLRMARGVQHSLYRLWFRGIVSFGELPPVLN